MILTRGGSFVRRIGNPSYVFQRRALRVLMLGSFARRIGNPSYGFSDLLSCRGGISVLITLRRDARTCGRDLPGPRGHAGHEFGDPIQGSSRLGQKGRVARPAFPADGPFLFPSAGRLGLHDRLCFLVRLRESPALQRLAVDRLEVGDDGGDHFGAVCDSRRAVLAQRLQPAVDGRLGQPARGRDLPAAPAGQRQGGDLRQQGFLPRSRGVASPFYGYGRVFNGVRHGRSPFPISCDSRRARIWMKSGHGGKLGTRGAKSKKVVDEKMCERKIRRLFFIFLSYIFLSFIFAPPPGSAIWTAKVSWPDYLSWFARMYTSGFPSSS